MISVRLILMTALLVLLCLYGAARASAALIEYRFVITAPFTDGSETFGGVQNPVTMNFFIDANAPNLSPGVGGIYYAGGFGSLSFDHTSNLSTTGQIQTGLNGAGAVFNAWAYGYNTATVENGRILLMDELSIYDPTRKLISSWNLPTALQTKSSTSIFEIMFSPAVSDPEYSTGTWIEFGTGWVSPTSFSTYILSAPEPSTWVMMLLGFTGLGYAGFRRRGARLA